MEVIMKKGMIYVVMLVAVLAIVYFAFIFPWPQSENAQGTIGGVKKYNAQQLSDKDVKLESMQMSEAELIELLKEAMKYVPEAQQKAIIETAQKSQVEAAMKFIPAENQKAILALAMKYVPAENQKAIMVLAQKAQLEAAMKYVAAENQNIFWKPQENMCQLKTRNIFWKQQ